MKSLARHFTGYYEYLGSDVASRASPFNATHACNQPSPGPEVFFSDDDHMRPYQNGIFHVSRHLVPIISWLGQGAQIQLSHDERVPLTDPSGEMADDSRLGSVGPLDGDDEGLFRLEWVSTPLRSGQ